MWIIIIEKIEENNIKTNRLTIWIWNLWIILSYKYNNSQKKIVEVDLILKYQYVKINCYQIYTFGLEEK